MLGKVWTYIKLLFSFTETKSVDECQCGKSRKIAAVKKNKRKKK
jgi:hypothetical protein